MPQIPGFLGFSKEKPGSKPGFSTFTVIRPSVGHADRLARFLESSVELMSVMARACGHDHLSGFAKSDLATWDDRMARLTGVAYSGFQLA